MSIEKRNQEIYNAYLDDIREYGEPRWDRIADTIPHIELSVRQIRRIARNIYNDIHPSLPDDDDGLPKSSEESVRFKITGNTAEASSTSKRIKTLDQLLEACDADLQLWRVDRHVVNVWEMGRKKKVVDLKWNDGRADGYVKDSGEWNQAQNWQVKANFVPRREYPLKRAVDDIIKQVHRHAPQYDVDEPLMQGGKYLFVPSLYDTHFGNRNGISLEQAGQDYKKVGLALMKGAMGSPKVIDRILFVVGQDFLHSDNIQGTTTRGTWVETSEDIRNVIAVACQSIVYVIEQMASLAPVDIIPVESNHDRLGVYWLGLFLDAWFRHYKNVSVRQEIMPRKYYAYGKTLLGLDHGDAGKPDRLLGMMAVEQPKLWGNSTYREWLRGHFHQKQKMIYPVTTDMGVTVRVLPALCDTDNYHKLHMFTGGKRAAEGLYYHKDHGPAGEFPVFVDELD